MTDEERRRLAIRMQIVKQDDELTKAIREYQAQQLREVGGMPPTVEDEEP